MFVGILFDGYKYPAVLADVCTLTLPRITYFLAGISIFYLEFYLCFLQHHCCCCKYIAEDSEPINKKGLKQSRRSRVTNSSNNFSYTHTQTKRPLITTDRYLIQELHTRTTKWCHLKPRLLKRGGKTNPTQEQVKTEKIRDRLGQRGSYAGGAPVGAIPQSHACRSSSTR